MALTFLGLHRLNTFPFPPEKQVARRLAWSVIKKRKQNKNEKKEKESTRSGSVRERLHFLSPAEGIAMLSPVHLFNETF